VDRASASGAESDGSSPSGGTYYDPTRTVFLLVSISVHFRRKGGKILKVQAILWKNQGATLVPAWPDVQWFAIWNGEVAHVCSSETIPRLFLPGYGVLLVIYKWCLLYGPLASAALCACAALEEVVSFLFCLSCRSSNYSLIC